MKKEYKNKDVIAFAMDSVVKIMSDKVSMRSLTTPDGKKVKLFTVLYYLLKILLEFHRNYYKTDHAEENLIVDWEEINNDLKELIDSYKQEKTE